MNEQVQTPPRRKGLRNNLRFFKSLRYFPEILTSIIFLAWLYLLYKYNAEGTYVSLEPPFTWISERVYDNLYYVGLPIFILNWALAIAVNITAIKHLVLKLVKRNKTYIQILKITLALLIIEGLIAAAIAGLRALSGFAS